MTHLEFQDYNFNDVRINKRFQIAFNSIQSSQSSLISTWSINKNELQGSYRLFANEKFSVDAMLEGHSKFIKREIKKHETTSDILISISDTCSVKLGLHPHTPNIGRISSKKAATYGLLTHTVLLVNATTNAPLGIAHQSYHYHKEKQEKKFTDKKESARWTKGLFLVHEMTGSRVIHIGDREADMFEFIEGASLINAKILIRQKHAREVLLVDGASSEETILDLLDVQEWSHTTSVKKPDTTLKFRVRYTSANLLPPQNYERTYLHDAEVKPIKMNIIQAVGQDIKGEIFDWIIVTNLLIENEHDAIEAIKLYSKRWHIESFHKVLKTGFDIEKCQLEDGVRIEKMIAMISIAAAKGYALLQLSRLEDPPVPEVFFNEDEIKALKLLMEKNEEELLTLPELVNFIARNGGFLKTKKYPNPGILTFWRGWYRIYGKIDMLSMLFKKGEIRLPIELN